MIEPQKSFYQAGLKVERAYQHIADLGRLVSSYIEARPYRLAANHDIQTGAVSVQIELTVPMPSTVALTLGDAVHNLKAALDYVWTGMHRAALKRNVDRVYFPIGNSRNDVIGRITEPAIKQAFPDIESFLGDRIKPHGDESAGGNLNFVRLNHLDRWDKHNLLVPCVSAVSDGDLMITVGRDKIKMTGNKTYSDKTINILTVMLAKPPPIHIEQYAEPTTEIVFGQGQPLEHEPIIPSLTKLAETVSETVEAFREVFGGAHGSPPTN